MLQIQTILFPTDRTAWSETAFGHAVRYAHHHGATLHVLTVSKEEGKKGRPPVIAPPEEPDLFSARLHKAAAEEAGVEIIYADLTAPSAARGILDYADRVGADLIVMATHGRRGLDHTLIGSVAEAVVRRSRCPVLTVRPTAANTATTPERILVPLDFSAHARTALAHARELCRDTRAELHLLHVVQTFPRYGIVDAPPEPEALSDTDREAAENRLREVAAEVLAPGAPPATHAVAGRGNPALAVLDVAERLDADLIVLASHGRSGIRHFLLGSVAEKVVQLAPCPVFTVKVFGESLLPGVTAQTSGELV